MPYPFFPPGHQAILAGRSTAGKLEWPKKKPDILFSIADGILFGTSPFLTSILVVISCRFFYSPILKVLSMKFPVWLKPGLWCAAGGAVAMMIAGFWGMGWTTAGTAEKMARARAETAVVTALVPFCIARAQGDGDAAKLTKFRASTSSYDRNEMVKANGWAAFAGASPDYQLIQACSERLHVAAG